MKFLLKKRKEMPSRVRVSKSESDSHNSYLCVSGLLHGLTEKCLICLISQLHPAVNFCNLEARDLFCKCCLSELRWHQGGLSR